MADKIQTHLIHSKKLLEGAITLVAALAVNDAAKKIINNVFVHNPNDTKAVAKAAIIYAAFIIVLVLCVVEAYNFTIIKNCERKNRKANATNSSNSSNSTKSEGIFSWIS